MELLRYIHRNPLKAGLAERLDSYKWNSHKGYRSKTKKWDWLHKDFILSMLSSDKKDQRRKYKEFVKVGSEEIERIFKGKKLPRNVAIYLIVYKERPKHDYDYSLCRLTPH